MTTSAASLFITGGSRGIGKAIVLAAAEAGWHVAFTYNTQAHAAQEVIEECQDRFPHVRVTTWALDVRNSEAVTHVAESVISEHGAIRAVVCNAGLNVQAPAFRFSDADWSAVIGTNLTGSFYVCRSFLPHFVSRRYGRIVLMGSSIAGGGRGQIAYAASKSALGGLAGTLAKEYGSRSITANVVVPGLFDTDMAKDAVEETRADYVRMSPMKRLGRLPELAATVLFLISDKASYINGQSIAVTGGLDWAP